MPDLSPFQDDKWLGFPAERGRPSSFRSLLERQLAESGMVNPSITTVDSLTAQKRLIEAGLGIALMPVNSIREELRIGSLRMIDITGINARVPVVAVRRHGGHQSPTVTNFLQVLADHTPGLRGR